MIKDPASKRIDQLARANKGNDAVWVYLTVAVTVMWFVTYPEANDPLFKILPALTATVVLHHHWTITPMAREIKRLRELLGRQQSESGPLSGAVVDS